MTHVLHRTYQIETGARGESEHHHNQAGVQRRMGFRPVMQLSSGCGVLLPMEGAMARKPGISDAGIIMLVGAAAAALASGCTVAVDDRHETVRSGRAQTAVSVFNSDRPESPPDLPVYPGAKAVTPPPPPFNVSFSGRFADTSAYSSHFATDDGVGLVLQFYRDAMRNYSERFECRGTVNVRARGGTEELRCIPHGGSDSVQLAVSVPGHHAIVRVAPAVTGSTFTLVNVRTRH